MNRHLLVTISDDQSALSGVRFVGSFFKELDELKVTLFYTAMSPEKSLNSVQAHLLSEQLQKAREERGNAAIAYALEVLKRHGFEDHHVDTKLKFGSSSKASDIVMEADRGLYDAVVLGKRGVSWLEEALGQSVTRELLDDTLSFPFWICRQPEMGRRNVLLCVDGSQPSLRMADHVGFILATQPAHEITLLTVNRPGDQRDPAPIFDDCLDVLRENGVDKSRVRTLVLNNNNTAQTILQQAEKGRFAAVAMGRTGSGGGLLQRFFMGSASSTLFNQLTGAVLWVCH